MRSERLAVLRGWTAERSIARDDAERRHEEKEGILSKGTVMRTALGVCRLLWLRLQAVSVRHADSADDRSDDADESLVGAAQKQIRQMGRAVELLVRGTVDRARCRAT